MSVSYQQILHNVAIRLNALVGSQVATITATYDVTPLTAANFKSADWPFNAIRDAILMAVEDFAWAIADTANHPWRANIGTTTSLADGSPFPATVGTARVIGVYGMVYDITDGVQCLEGEFDEIARVKRLTAAGILTLPVYLYRIDGQRIRHTRTNVTIEVCTFDRTAQLTAFNGNGDLPLPDVLELPITARALSILTKDGAFADQAKVYEGYANTALMRIREGLASVGSKSLPVSAGEDA